MPRRRYIPKPDGRRRPLGIPTVRDRVVQMAAKLVLEPIFEADFQPCRYGFRPKRSATQALETIRLTGGRGHCHVVDADIQGFFDAIDQDLLMEKLAARISDRRVLKLLRQWLQAGVRQVQPDRPLRAHATGSSHGAAWRGSALEAGRASVPSSRVASRSVRPGPWPVSVAGYDGLSWRRACCMRRPSVSRMR